MKKSGKSYRSGQHGEKSSGKFFRFDPDDLTIVTEEGKILFDERAMNDFDENMVRNIMVYGVIEPIIVTFDGEKDGKPVVKVVDGKQRTINTREANRRRREAGEVPIDVPCVVKEGDESKLTGIMISANEIRKEDLPLVKVNKLERLLATGATDEDAANAFGVTVVTIKNWKTIGGLHTSVKKLIAKGEVQATVAAQLAKLPKDEQPAALDKLIASGDVKGARGLEAARQVRRGGEATATKSRMLSRVKLEEAKKKLKAGEGKVMEIAYAVVQRILGHERAFVNYPQLREVFDGKEDILAK